MVPSVIAPEISMENFAAKKAAARERAKLKKQELDTMEVSFARLPSLTPRTFNNTGTVFYDTGPLKGRRKPKPPAGRKVTPACPLVLCRNGALLKKAAQCGQGRRGRQSQTARPSTSGAWLPDAKLRRPAAVVRTEYFTYRV